MKSDKMLLKPVQKIYILRYLFNDICKMLLPYCSEQLNTYRKHKTQK